MKTLLRVAVVLVPVLAGLGCGQSDELVQNGVQSATICEKQHERIFNRMTGKIPDIDERVWGRRRKATAMSGTTIPGRERIDGWNELDTVLCEDHIGISDTTRAASKKKPITTPSKSYRRRGGLYAVGIDS